MEVKTKITISEEEIFEMVQQKLEALAVALDGTFDLEVGRYGSGDVVAEFVSREEMAERAVIEAETKARNAQVAEPLRAGANAISEVL